ncbi:hypothetical protein GUITHDRAFT_150522, partial [Guillardia theta CCMP2712]
ENQTKAVQNFDLPGKVAETSIEGNIHKQVEKVQEKDACSDAADHLHAGDPEVETQVILSYLSEQEKPQAQSSEAPDFLVTPNGKLPLPLFNRAPAQPQGEWFASFDIEEGRDRYVCITALPHVQWGGEATRAVVTVSESRKEAELPSSSLEQKPLILHLDRTSPSTIVDLSVMEGVKEQKCFDVSISFSGSGQGACEGKNDESTC